MAEVKKRPVHPSVEQVCLGLSDPTRLKLLSRIGRVEVCVCDLQAHVDRDQPTVSRHLAMLRKCGLATCEKRGRWCYYRRAPLPPRLSRIVDLAAPPIRPGSRDGCC